MGVRGTLHKLRIAMWVLIVVACRCTWGGWCKSATGLGSGCQRGTPCGGRRSCCYRPAPCCFYVAAGWT
ncbi:hypothetical protein Shyhy02_58770 [Streptomyces hygroscopicus subsp. hygroscopicus]|nr:hypothetical protein Shyhy02_58770 [Streptomyces hygroscopicus subsp. hygroscopicus]